MRSSPLFDHVNVAVNCMLLEHAHQGKACLSGSIRASAVLQTHQAPPDVSRFVFTYACSLSLPPAGFYNFWIGVKYTRVVPDRKNHRVVIDLIETIVSTI